VSSGDHHIVRLNSNGGPSPAAEVRRNIFYDSDDMIALGVVDAGFFYAKNNTFDLCGTAIKNYYFFGAIVFNNIISNCTIGLEGQTFLVCDYNDVFNCDTAYTGGLQLGGNSINADPLFVQPGIGDYRIMPGSPCVDAGNPSNDSDPDGSVPDLGAIPLGGL
jgi:hypothetical protein